MQMLKPPPALRFEGQHWQPERTFSRCSIYCCKIREEQRGSCGLNCHETMIQAGLWKGLVCIASVDEVSESLPSYHTVLDSIKTLSANAKKYLVFWTLCFAYYSTTLPSFPTSDARKELPSPSEQNYGGQPIIVARWGSDLCVCWVTKAHLAFCQLIRHALRTPIWRH